MNIQDDCLEVGIGQDVHLTLQTWPRFCDVAYSKSYQVPGMGCGVVKCYIGGNTKEEEFPFCLVKCHDARFSNMQDVSLIS